MHEVLTKKKKKKEELHEELKIIAFEAKLGADGVGFVRGPQVLFFLIWCVFYF